MICGITHLFVAVILHEFFVKVKAFLRYGEYGCKACALALGGSALIVSFGVSAVSYKVLASPAFPYQLQQTLFKDVVQIGFYGRHSGSFSYGVKLCLSVFAVAYLSLGLHQQGIGISV